MSDDRCSSSEGLPTLALEIPDNTFTDRGYQRVELLARGGVDPIKLS